MSYDSEAMLILDIGQLFLKILNFCKNVFNSSNRMSSFSQSEKELIRFEELKIVSFSSSQESF